MASLGGTYDASQGEQMSERSVLPPGEYLAAIARSDVVDTKKGDGRKVTLEFEVLDGVHRGRRFWSTLNLWNRNAQAVEIAQRELNSICHAIGKLRVADTEELHGVPMLVKLGIDKDSPNRNVPQGYKPAAGAAAGAPGIPRAVTHETQSRAVTHDNQSRAGAGTASARGPWA